MVRSLMVVCALLAAGDEKPKTPPAPVAMILTTQGTVTLERGPVKRPLRAMDLLRPGDVLRAGDGEAVLVLLDDGTRQRLKPKGQATVGDKGCTPAAAVERQDKGKLSARQLAGLRDLANSGRAGVVAVRGVSGLSGESLPPPLVTPVYGATLLTDKPTLSWPPFDKADNYQVQLWSGDGQRLIWRAPTEKARLAYPEKQPALKPGTKYLWRVRARLGEDKDLGQIVDSKFSLATKAEAEELATLKPLAASDEVADLLLAAVTYEAHGVYDEALALYEKLAEKQPAEANFHVALASYYERGGRMDKAKAAREKAKKLGAMLPEQ